MVTPPSRNVHKLPQKRISQWSPTGPYPAYDTRRGEEFSERSPNFLNCVQYFKIISNTFFQRVRNFLKIFFALPGYGPGHQSVGRWLILYVFCSKNSLTKLVGYQQPACLCVKMEFVVGTISLSCELYSLLWSCVRSCGVGIIVYGKWCFVSHLLWKLHG